MPTLTPAGAPGRRQASAGPRRRVAISSSGGFSLASIASVSRGSILARPSGAGTAAIARAGSLRGRTEVCVPGEPIPPDAAAGPAPDLALASTRTLILRIRSGDEAAREELFARLLPGLRRWAHGRLPAAARDLDDTDDLVQTSLARAFRKVEEFEPRRDGAFLAYVHQILINCIREEIRRVRRRPERAELPEEVPDERAELLGRSLGPGAIEAYEAALPLLPEEQQQAVILRLEFGFSYREMAAALARPTPNAARMLFTRGLVRLARLMDEARR